MSELKIPLELVEDHDWSLFFNLSTDRNYSNDGLPEIPKGWYWEVSESGNSISKYAVSLYNQDGVFINDTLAKTNTVRDILFAASVVIHSVLAYVRANREMRVELGRYPKS